MSAWQAMALAGRHEKGQEKVCMTARGLRLKGASPVLSSDSEGKRTAAQVVLAQLSCFGNRTEMLFYSGCAIIISDSQAMTMTMTKLYQCSAFMRAPFPVTPLALAYVLHALHSSYLWKLT